jgi:NADPH-dependent glutamate synthase beta subunit-like oxidoreductase/Pyruvate/2-oxoacid:ferredoxin oxidoreductase delta subunit
VAQRAKLGITTSEAYVRAWNILAAVNPFPAALGRICPHPCEDGCARAAHDGAVAINALERFLGDWALRAGLALPTLDSGAQSESIGVIGAGPAGLSFAYQMARRGYRTTVYEQREKPGGMLSWAIPSFRLPEDIVHAEIRRIEELGVQLRLNTMVGRDVSTRELCRLHSLVFVGVGATRGVELGIPGEAGDGVRLGVDYLGAMKRKESLALGLRVIVIGGGNTALDAARVARRSGANVTVLYRRSVAEMPGNTSEIQAAVSEGVILHCLAAPVRVERTLGVVTAVVAQRMRLGAPDASGRRQPIPEPDGEFTLPADSVIVAVSQRSDWDDLEYFRPRDFLDASAGFASHGIFVLAGGDALHPGIAGAAIVHGRRAAEAAHAKLRRLPAAATPSADAIGSRPVVKARYYAAKERVCVPSRSPRQRLAEPDAEIGQTLTEEAFLAEVTRCFSCGLCFGCEQCHMYCSAGVFDRLEQTNPGAYYALDLNRCEGCGKCIELCPCDFLTSSSSASPAEGRQCATSTISHAGHNLV